MPVDTAVSPVDATTLAGSTSASAAAAVHDFSIWAMFLNADIVVKFVMVLLLLASFWAWAIIFDKWITFKVRLTSAACLKRVGSISTVLELASALGLCL